MATVYFLPTTIDRYTYTRVFLLSQLQLDPSHRKRPKLNFITSLSKNRQPIKQLPQLQTT